MEEKKTERIKVLMEKYKKNQTIDLHHVKVEDLFADGEEYAEVDLWRKEGKYYITRKLRDGDIETTLFSCEFIPQEEVE